MKNSPKTLFIILILFTLLTLILFWPIFLGKVNLNGHLLVSFYSPYGENLPYKPTGWDQLRIYFPFYKVTLDQIRHFQWSLWNPYVFAGHPHLADFQTAVFYPLTIFGFFLSQIEYWHLLRITPMILASFFTFLYLSNLPAGKAGFRISKLASIFGAMTFGFSPFILTWGEEVVMSPHSIVWLPLILFAIDKYLAFSPRHPEPSTPVILRPKAEGSGFFVNTQNDQKKYLIIISLATAFSLFGGYIQTTIYLFIFVGIYFLFRLWQGLRRFNLAGVSGVMVAFILGVMIAAIQLFPSAELYFNSARSQIALRETLFQFLLPVSSLLTFLAPDFFGHPATGNFLRGGSAQYYEGILFIGIAPLVFALSAIFSRSK